MNVNNERDLFLFEEPVVNNVQIFNIKLLVLLSVLLSWFSGTPYTGTQLNRSDKMHR
jgi:hypothetical protein